MDRSGKLIYTRNRDILSIHIISQTAAVSLSTKEIGSTEILATYLLYSPNGRFVTVVGDSEFIIYTSLTWRNNSFGNGISVACVPDSNTYAVLFWRVYENFRERPGTGMKGSGSWSMESLHGRILLFVMFWDWESWRDC